MYLSPKDSEQLESVRKVVDPIQFGLIPAHVTLCREEELDSFNEIEARLKNTSIDCIELEFGKPKIFFEHGIIMECINGLVPFQAFREYLLDTKDIKVQHPHITLAHPRNFKAKGNSLDNTNSLVFPLRVELDRVHLIEQIGINPWNVLAEYKLGANTLTSV